MASFADAFNPGDGMTMDPSAAMTDVAMSQPNVTPPTGYQPGLTANPSDMMTRLTRKILDDNKARAVARQQDPGFDPASQGVEPNQQAPTQDLSQYGVPVQTADDTKPQQKMPNVLGALVSGAKAGLGEVGETFGGSKSEEEFNPAAAGFEVSDLSHPWAQGLPKVAYQLAKSFPTLAGGVAGGAAGAAAISPVASPAAAPLGGLLGGAAGAGVMSAVQTLGPAYHEELQKTPDDPSGAYNRALDRAMRAGEFSGLAWMAFPLRFFQGPVKQAAMQILAVQPGLSVAEQAVENKESGQPLTQGLGQAYVQGAVGTAIPMAGHAAVSRLSGRAGAERSVPPSPGETEPGAPPAAGAEAPGTTPGGEPGAPPRPGGGEPNGEDQLWNDMEGPQEPPGTPGAPAEPGQAPEAPAPAAEPGAPTPPPAGSPPQAWAKYDRDLERFKNQQARQAAETGPVDFKTNKMALKEWGLLKDYGLSDEEIGKLSTHQGNWDAAVSEARIAGARQAGDNEPGTRSAPVDATQLPDVRGTINPDPTPAQAQAENFKHVHVEIPELGLEGANGVSIETVAGGTRKGTDPDGTPWTSTMGADYGRIKGTIGADGQPLDIFVGPNTKEATHVYVLDQRDPTTGKFDEHKIFAGFNSIEEANQAYLSSHDATGLSRMGGIRALTPEEFRDWIKSGKTTEPLSDTMKAAATAAPTGVPEGHVVDEKGVTKEEEADDNAGRIAAGQQEPGGGGAPGVAPAPEEPTSNNQSNQAKTEGTSAESGVAHPTQADISAAFEQLRSQGIPRYPHDHVDVTRAVRIAAAEGYNFDDAFQIAVLRNRIDDGFLTPEQIRAEQPAATAEAVLNPEPTQAETSPLLVTPGAPQRGVPSQAPSAGTGRAPAASESEGGAARGGEDGHQEVTAGAEVAEGGGGTEPNPTGTESHAGHAEPDTGSHAAGPEHEPEEHQPAATGGEPAAEPHDAAAEAAGPAGEHPAEHAGAGETAAGPAAAGNLTRVVDAAGKPLTVYHGTPRTGFAQFDRLAGEAFKRGMDTTDAVGSWFTTSAKDARGFGENVIQATLDIRNPLVVHGWDGLTDVAKANNLERTVKKTRDYYQISGKKLRSWLEKNGYDGIHMIGGEDAKPDLDYWVALNPEQIHREEEPRPTKVETTSALPPEHPGLVIKSLETGKVTELKPKAEDKWKEIGKNAEGQTLYEDKNGVRSVLDGNVRITEPVPVQPTRSGVKTITQHKDEWQLATEAPKAEEKPPIADHGGQSTAPEAEKPEVNLARALMPLLSARTLTSKTLQQEAEKAFGSTLAQGKFDRKDMYDAMELAFNMLVKTDPGMHIGIYNDWRSQLQKLDRILEKMPTQTVRTEEMVRFQQFSTPPPYALAVAYAAGLQDHDVVLEPSAGTGSLVAAATRPDVRIVANELSPRRAAMLRALVGKQGQVTTEDAEQLDNILPSSVKPTVVMMNPPFSQTAGRMGDKKVLETGAKHIEQALGRLEPGGRLVSIVGGGMSMDAPRFRPWWNNISKEYTVRANIAVEGKVYGKYGTQFPTRLLIIDKVPPTAENRPVLAQVGTVQDLMQALEPIRNDRPSVQRVAPELQPAQPSGVEVAETGPSGGPAPLPAHPEPGVLGSGAKGADGVPGPGPAGSGGPGQPAAGVEAGERPPVVGVEPERPIPAGTGEQPVAGAAGGEQPKVGGGTGAEPGVQPAAKPEPSAPTSIERIELEKAAPGSQQGAMTEALYEPYQPQRLQIKGAVKHPGPLVESAAMSSVLPPAPTYKPAIPQKVIEKGMLSLPQMEAVVGAGQAHQETLPAAEGEVQRRKGYFIGDGTGVGKGREIAGIILDNFQQGRTKAVWVSEKRKLLNDAQRDWSGLGQDKNQIFNIGKTKPGDPVKGTNGIAFTTYDTLKGGMNDQAAVAKGGFSRGETVKIVDPANTFYGKAATVTGKAITKNRANYYPLKFDDGTTAETLAGHLEIIGERKVPKTRIDQLVDWVGKDFDGVIAFDEAHNMGNATQTKGKRGNKEAAMKALAGIELQARLPNARVVYVSATGATEVSNLAYADRLGLWGRGTPFADRSKFVNEVEGGGIAAMELIARDMKQLGLYIARNLSYDGVEYDRLQHTLSPAQREIYDTSAEAWQIVLKNIHAALETSNSDKRAKSNAMSAFWGGHQRFFNQVITSLQMPTVIKAVEQDLKEGRQAVLQLTNTNEASQERAAAKAETEDDIEELDITPRDQIIQLVEKSFPTQQYEDYVDESGNERKRPVFDKEGNPVHNKKAMAMKEALLDRLSSIKVPQGPLDMVLDHFGHEVVSEVTGRGRRFIMKEDEKSGRRKRMEDVRPASANQSETDTFQAGKKKVLVFSEAGGTGASYHADNGSQSKDARRAHYLVQAGWRADKAVQGFGRTHRTNQASAPIFHLVSTDIDGQKRFISSIARRLGQLGALTKGQRQAGEQGVFGARDNLESPEARQALAQFWRELAMGNVEGIDGRDFEAQTGLVLNNRDSEGRPLGMADPPEITQFLNRLLSLKLEMQGKVFTAFSDRLDGIIEALTQAGRLDVGLETVRADKIAKDSEQTVHTDKTSGADTKYVKLTLSHKFRPLPFPDSEMASKIFGAGARRWVKSPRGKVYAAPAGPTLTKADTGALVENYRLISPVSPSRIEETSKIDNKKNGWQKITGQEAELLWQAETDRAPEFTKQDMHLITGAVLPIWDRLKGSTRVVRMQTDDGERLLGRVVPESGIAATLRALGAEAGAKKISPQDLHQRLLFGATAKLANDWTFKRSMVAGEHRIELRGPSSFSEGQLVQKEGAFSERINYENRYFVPTDPVDGPKVLAALTEHRPVVEVAGGGGEDESAASIPLAPESPALTPQAEARRLKQTPTAIKARRRVEADIRTLLEHLLGKRAVEFRFPDQMGNVPDAVLSAWGEARKPGNVVAGMFTPQDKFSRAIIQVAMALPDEYQGGRSGIDLRVHTALHEAIHALESEMATDQERALMVRETPRLRKMVQEDRGLTDEQVASMADHEIRAEAGRIYMIARANGETPRVHIGLRGLWERMMNIARRVKAYFTGEKIGTWEDLMDAFYEGKMADRLPQLRDGEWHAERTSQASLARAAVDGTIRDRISALFPEKTRTGFIEKIQDYNYRMKLLQNAVESRFHGWTGAEARNLDVMSSSLPDAKQFAVLKELMPGKVSERINEFRRDHLKPLVDLANANKASLSDIGDYLKAKGAVDRNAMIADIHPEGHQFKQAMTNPDIVGGSGLSENQARAIMAGFEAAHGPAALEMWRRAKAMVDFNREMMVQYGLESRETINNWAHRSPDYMPYRMWEEVPDDDPERGDGRNLGVIGRETKQAFGRTSSAENPLVHLIDQAYHTIERGERNTVFNSLAESLMDLKRAGGNIDDIATINRGKLKKVINRETGLVMTVNDNADKYRPNAVNFKRYGKQAYMVFKDRKLAEAIKTTSPYQLGALNPVLRAVNEMKAFWTHYSPDFAARHFFGRYMVEGVLNAYQLKDTGRYSPGKWLTDAFPALGRASRAIYARERGEDAGRLGRYWDEMKEHGGHMAFRAMRDIDSTRRELAYDLKDLTGKPHLSGLARIRGASLALDKVFNTWDNATRLATYAQARDQGMTPQQASIRARNATINYQKRGQLSNWAGLIAPFFNTAIQTGTRMGGAMTRSKVMQKVFVGTIGAGAGIAMWNYLAGGNDKDGVPWFEKLAAWDRALNLIILNPFERTPEGGPMPYRIPMPYNYALPLNMGYQAAGGVMQASGMFKSHETGAGRAGEVLKSALQAFTPFDVGGNKIDMFTPEVLRPFAHIAENQTWTGAPLHPDQGQHGPNAYSGWPDKAGNVKTGAGYKYAAETVNDWTGGSQSKSGLADFYPEDYKELFDQLFGAQSRFVQEAYNTGSAATQGQAPKSTEMPIERVFRGADYTAADAAMQAHQNYIARHPWLQ